MENPTQSQQTPQRDVLTAKVIADATRYQFFKDNPFCLVDTRRGQVGFSEPESGHPVSYAVVDTYRGRYLTAKSYPTHEEAVDAAIEEIAQGTTAGGFGA